MASLTMACPVSSAASHGNRSPEGGTTNTSPGTRDELGTLATSEEGGKREERQLFGIAVLVTDLLGIMLSAN